MPKARIKQTNEIVNLTYDDDDLYLVIGRGAWLTRDEFDWVADDEETENALPWRTIDRTYDDKISSVTRQQMFPFEEENSKIVAYNSDDQTYAVFDASSIDELDENPLFTHYFPLTPPKENIF